MKYRFGDPNAYKRQLKFSGAVFVVAWHMALYSFYKYKVSRLSDDEKKIYSTLNTSKFSGGVA